MLNVLNYRRTNITIIIPKLITQIIIINVVSGCLFFNIDYSDFNTYIPTNVYGSSSGGLVSLLPNLPLILQSLWFPDYTQIVCTFLIFPLSTEMLLGRIFPDFRLLS